MKSKTENNYKNRIFKTQLYIQHHLDEELPLEKLAGIAYFSSFHFHRIFKAYVGENIQTYIRRLRIERAIMQLQYENTPIIDIAFKAGYQSHEAFSRHIKKVYQLTPQMIRETNGFSPQPHQDITYQNFKEYTMNVIVKTIEPITVIFERHIGSYRETGAAWKQLIHWASENNFWQKNATALKIGIPHDDPGITAEDKLRYDACLSIEDHNQDYSEIHQQSIAGGKYAIAEHIGPYENFTDSYTWLYGSWLSESGEEPADRPGFVVYKNESFDEAPENLRSDIYIPLK